MRSFFNPPIGHLHDDAVLLLRQNPSVFYCLVKIKKQPMKLNSVVRSDLSISSVQILFRSIMFFPTKSCRNTTLFFSMLVQSWAMLHIPRYISSSRLRLSNFFIPFERPYADEVFDINRSAGSLCVFPGERLKSAQNSTFFETLSEPRLSRGSV